MSNVQVTVFRDIEGYSIKDYGSPSDAAGATNIWGPTTGLHIVGNSGQYEKHIYSGQNEKMWRRLRKIETANHLAAFTSDFGPLGRFHEDELYDVEWTVLERHLRELQVLAVCTEQLNREAFATYASGWKVFDQRLMYVPDDKKRSVKGTLDLVSQPTTLAEFLVWQMWNSLGDEDHPAHEVQKICLRCREPFKAGGRRSGSRRADAKFCSKKCKDSVMHQRKKARIDTFIAR